MRLLLALLALVTLTLASPIDIQPGQQQQQQPRKCNLNPSVCDRQYSKVTYIGTHNSAFVGDRSDPRVNQQKTVTQQLDAGIRFLQAQVHEMLGMLRMCHTECLLFDAGSLEDYLKEVKVWIDSHPEEVVTLLLVNGDDRPAGEFDEVFTSTGLKDLAFIPSTSPEPLALDAWPTLGEMIDADTRLVTFLSTSADESTIPYLLSEFDAYFFETPFETTDPAFPSCALHRPSGASPEGRMYIMNHFLQHEILPDVLVPAVGSNFATNAAEGEGSIGAHVATCEGVWGRKPNFVLVDMFDRGNVFGAQGGFNGF